MSTDKIYVKGIYPRQKWLKNKAGEEFEIFTLALNKDQLAEAFREHGKTNKNGAVELRVKLTARREPSETGITHSVILDTYEPKPQSGQPSHSQPPRNSHHNQDKANGYAPSRREDDEVPF